MTIERLDIRSNTRKGQELNSDHPPTTKWKLVDEIGFQKSSGASQTVSHVVEHAPDATIQLHFPSYAGKSADGTVLIGDELATEKVVPFRFESRTVAVSKNGTVKFDSKSQGIDDGIGCLINEDSFAVLRRTTWELLIVSSAGVVTKCLPLWSHSKRMPRSVSYTDRDTFLLVFCNRVREVELLEIDRQGRLLWSLPNRAAEIGLVGSVQWLTTDTLLIADPFRHVVIEIDRAGNVLWRFGQPGEPSQAMTSLSSPACARRMLDGRTLIADTRNHRVLVADSDGASHAIRVADNGLCDPLYADILDDGNYLVCDTGNRRVIELSPSGDIVWSSTPQTAPHRLFSYPRSVEAVDDHNYLIADTANDRIVVFDSSTSQVLRQDVHVDPPLFWPRCVRSLPSGGTLIADGRNGRILEVSKHGDVVNQLCEINLDGRTPLKDPHEVRMLPGGRLLIVDSSRDLVAIADWSGNVFQAVGETHEPLLRDPHSAQQLPDGRLLIADTGNHRILIVDSAGKVHRSLDALEFETSIVRLNYPRYAEVIDDATLIIADTGNNRVLAATLEGRLIWEFASVPETAIDRLNQPRWVWPISQNEIVVCDHYHHRILRVKRETT
ncbi:MAG: PQQ-binding-like beta-propeller repeat protein [Planctomycetales bacterium]|nr:PQQ-binding-like beta-propeller repeat protein [Planctomycetales bacterium]